MNIGLPVWKGRISPVFDEARRLLVVEVKDGVEINRSVVSFKDESLMRRATHMADLSVDVLICGGISRTLADLLDGFKITVIPWISGDVDEVLAAYVAGDLPNPQFVMPGH